MSLLGRLLLFCLIQLSRSDCVLDNHSLDSAWEKKLHTDLELNHTTSIAPSAHTEVKFRLSMKYFSLDEEESLFSLYGWKYLQWVDERLKWDPKLYYGIETTQFWSYTFWVPILVLNNEIVSDTLMEGYYGLCSLEHTGVVRCVPRVQDDARCVSSLSNWPYDVQKCTLEYGISPRQKNVKLIPFFKRAVGLLGAEYGSEWTIIDYEQTGNVSETIQLKMTFTLERNAEGLAALLVFPSKILSILNIFTFLVDVRRLCRLWLACLSVFCHFVFLSVMADHIPKHSWDTPTILLYYRSSMLLSSSSLLITLCLTRMRDRLAVPWYWMQTVNNFFLGSKVKYIFWPRWKTDSNVGSDEVNEKDVEVWNDSANIINTTCFILYIIVYTVLMVAYLPRVIDYAV